VDPLDGVDTMKEDARWDQGLRDVTGMKSLHSFEPQGLDELPWRRRVRTNRHRNTVLNQPS